MITGLVISGSAEDGLIVHAPALQPVSVSGMLNSMVSASAVTLASWMASMSVQVLLHVPSGVATPVSAVELTVKGAAAWVGLSAIPTAITSATNAAVNRRTVPRFICGVRLPWRGGRGYVPLVPSSISMTAIYSYVRENTRPRKS